MMNLIDIQNRFHSLPEKEHWKKLQMLLFSKDAEYIVTGMHLLESLDDISYIDGLCILLEFDDDQAPQKLRFSDDFDIQNPVGLAGEMIRIAESDLCKDHALYLFLKQGLLDDLLWDVFCYRHEESIVSDLVLERMALYSKTFTRVAAASQKYQMGMKEGQKAMFPDVHHVDIEFTKNFWIQKYPVTQALWLSVMNYNFDHEYLGLRYPAFSMSWLEAVIFCNKLSQIDGFETVYEIPDGAEVLSRKVYKSTDDEVDACVAKITMNLEANGYRLPFEHEWEYAARGGENYTFAGSDDYNDVAWCGDNCKEPQPVGLLKPNGYGLYDMSGCVTEYTSTPFMKIVPSEPLTYDPSLSDKKSARGGSWWELFFSSGVAERDIALFSMRGSDSGFRLCRFAL